MPMNKRPMYEHLVLHLYKIEIFLAKIVILYLITSTEPRFLTQELVQWSCNILGCDSENLKEKRFERTCVRKCLVFFQAAICFIKPCLSLEKL